MSSMTGNALAVLVVGGLAAWMAGSMISPVEEKGVSPHPSLALSSRGSAPAKVEPAASGFGGTVVVGAAGPSSENTAICGAGGNDCRAPEAAAQWYANRPKNVGRPRTGVYADTAEVKRVRENYYCDLAVQAREYCEKLSRGEEAHKQCLNINLYFSYSRLCGRQP